MSSMNVGINSAGLEEIKGKLETAREHFGEVVNEMKTEIDKIPENWAGHAAEAYIEQFESLQPSFQNVDELIETISTQIGQVVEASEGLDEEIAGILNGG